MVTQRIWLPELGVEIVQSIKIDEEGYGAWHQKVLKLQKPRKMENEEADDRMIMDEYWKFKATRAPIYEVESSFDQKSFDRGYDKGYEQGFEDAGGRGPREPEFDKEKLKKYVESFPKWVEKQRMDKDSFSCDSDIRISFPDRDENGVWAFWAAHNCEDYTLLLTVVLDEEAINKLVGYYGAPLSSKGCTEVKAFSGAVACEFDLKMTNEGFGMLFAGNFTPIFYLTDWEKTKGWADSFIWW